MTHRSGGRKEDVRNIRVKIQKFKKLVQRIQRIQKVQKVQKVQELRKSQLTSTFFLEDLPMLKIILLDSTPKDTLWPGLISPITICKDNGSRINF